MPLSGYLMRPLTGSRKILNFQRLLVTAMAMLSTFLCSTRGYEADFPLTATGIAVVFPVVFSIGRACKRRKAALDHYVSIKLNGRALYLAARDWLAEKDMELLNKVSGGNSPGCLCPAGLCWPPPP